MSPQTFVASANLTHFVFGGPKMSFFERNKFRWHLRKGEAASKFGGFLFLEFYAAEIFS